MRLAGIYALVAAILAVAFAGAILTGPYRAVERSDYMTYHVAARIVLAGDGACLYDMECQAAVQLELIGEEPSFERGALPYNSPPWLAALLAPLGLLPLHVGFAIFTILSLLLLGAASWRITRGSTGTQLLASVLLLTAWPTVMGAIRGQVTLAAVGVLGLSVAASRFRSGGFLGFAFIKPTLVPLWGLWQLLGAHWRAVGTAAAVLVVMIGVSAAVVSPQALVAYPGHLVGVAEPDARGVHAAEMVNWRGAAVRLGVGPWLVVAGTLATVGLVVATWWRSRSRYLAAAAAFVATPLVIPHANQHETILAAVGVILAVSAVHDWRGWMIVGAIGLHAVLWAGPVLEARTAAWLLFSAQALCLAVVVWLAWRLGAAESSEPGPT